MTSGTPTRAPLPEPTREQLLLAFRNLRRPNIWPSTLEEALKHPTLGVCLRNAARQLGRAPWTGKASASAPPAAAPATSPPAPPTAPPRAPPQTDFKRLAANDRDDPEDQVAARPATPEAPAAQPAPTAPSPMPTTTRRVALPTLSQAQAQRVHRQAVRSLIESIESECPSLTLIGHRWWDTRSMVDPMEHTPELVDLNAEILDLALELGVAEKHPDPRRPYLVRVVDQARGM